MVSYRFAVFAGLAAALPLNINLGAYSPALVVGKETPILAMDILRTGQILTGQQVMVKSASEVGQMCRT